MAGIIAFGILGMPIVASTVACIVIALLRLVIPFQGATNYAFLWWGALIVGVPASLLGTFIFTSMVRTFCNRLIGCVAMCGMLGAVLGCVGFAILDEAILSISLVGGRVSRPADSFTYLMYTTAVMTGGMSGTIFGLVGYALVGDYVARTKLADDRHS